MRNSLHAINQAIETALLLARAAVSTSVSHWALSVFSIAAAFGLWFAVQDIENPRSEGIVPCEDELPIEVQETNRPEGVVVGTLPTVRVKVEAREADLCGLHKNDFSATVDLSGIVAEKPVLLPVVVTTQRGGVQVLGVLPAAIEVKATKVFEKSFDIELITDGDLPDDHELDGIPEIDPRSVTVSGDQSSVEFVATVEAVIDIRGLRETATFEDVALVVKTASGSRITTVTLAIDSVSVVYPVHSIFSAKTVLIEPAWTGEPAAGYVVTSVQQSENSVRISGLANFVESVDSIRNEPVNITGAKTPITEIVNLAVPDKVTAEITEIVLTITIEPIQTSATSLVGPTFVGLADGLQIAPGVFSVLVTLRGPAELLAQLSVDDLVVTISLDGLEEGTHTIQPVFSPPEGVEADPIEATEVTLVLVAAEAP